MNPRIEKLRDEIEKTKEKISKAQIRQREMEKQLTDLENADIVSAIRGVDIAPDEFAAFVQMFKEKQKGSTVPNLDFTKDTKSTVSDTVLPDIDNKNDEEESI